MNRAHSDIAFTPVVRDIQTRMGSRAGHEAFDNTDDRRDQLGEAEASFIEARDGFHQATVSETGWPCVQYKGGPASFLRVLDAKTIAYADFRGNRQYISVGNLKTNDRVSIILMDHVNRRRLKILGRVNLVDEAEAPVLIARLEMPSSRACVERAFVITVDPYDWNCPQHITLRFTDAEVSVVVDDLKQEIASLRKQLDEAKQGAAQSGTVATLGTGPLQLAITGVRQLTPHVRAYELRDVNGQALPPVRAGAHLDVPVKLKRGLTSHRRYSISSNPSRRDAYEIAVLRDAAGTGGSAAIHDTYQLGTVLSCEMPGNDFTLTEGDGPVVLIATGIGITPIKSMALELLAQGRDFVLHYAYRSRSQAAYLDRLEKQIGDRLMSHDSSLLNRLDVKALFTQWPDHAHVYVCGPDSLIESVRAAGLADAQVHHEQFKAPSHPEQKSFVMQLAKSSHKIVAPPDISALQVLENARGERASGLLSRPLRHLRGQRQAWESYPPRHGADRRPKSRWLDVLVCFKGAKR